MHDDRAGLIAPVMTETMRAFNHYLFPPNVRTIFYRSAQTG